MASDLFQGKWVDYHCVGIISSQSKLIFRYHIEKVSICLTWKIMGWSWWFMLLKLTKEQSTFKWEDIKEHKGSSGSQVLRPRYIFALESGTLKLNSCNLFGQLCKTESWRTRHLFQTLNKRCLRPNLVIKKSNVFFCPFQPVLSVESHAIFLLWFLSCDYWGLVASSVRLDAATVGQFILIQHHLVQFILLQFNLT